MELFGLEGLLATLAPLALPFLLLFGLYRLLPPWGEARKAEELKEVVPAEG